MADTITVAAYHDGLPTKEEMDGRERVIVSDDGTDKTVTAEVLKTYIGEISGGNAEELAVWESAADANSVTISTRKKTDEIGTMRRSVTIPVATETQAGVMSAEQVKVLAAAGNCVSAEALETEITERKAADATLAADITTAKTDIATNAANIATAQADITQAKSNIADVQSAVQIAQKTAQAASEEASAAKSAAETAESNAANAASAAAAAQSSATAAQETADGAKSAASAAQASAESASTKAESAQTAADNAQSTADAASTAASAASTEAESASTAASEAKTAAENASTKAEAAQATADAHAEELSAHADTLKSHGTRITALEESGGGTAAVTHFMALAGEDCTVTINGTAHALTAHKPYETDLSLADDTLSSLVFDEAATRSLRTVRFTGKKVKWRAGDRFFCALPLLTSADITAIDTGGAAIMSFFVACPRVTRIDGLESLDTSAFPQIRGLHTCTALEKADPSLWDTSSATAIDNFLYSCPRITGQIDISQWDTSKVKSITGSVNTCGFISSIDLSGWDFSSLTTFRMGGDVSSLTDVYAGEGWGKMPGDSPVLDLSGFTQWKRNSYGQNTVKTLLDLYDRAANGMGTMTLKLSSNTYAALTSAEIATLTAKGYTVTK